MAKLENFNYGGGYLMGVGYLRYREADDYGVYLNNLENPKVPSFEYVCRLRHKNAWVVRDTANGTVCLQSYSTIVSMQLPDGGSVDFGRWSNTTTRHQGDFRDWCREHSPETSG